LKIRYITQKLVCILSFNNTKYFILSIYSCYLCFLVLYVFVIISVWSHDNLWSLICVSNQCILRWYFPRLLFPFNGLWISAIDKYSNLKCKRDHKPNNKSTTTTLWNYKKTCTKTMLLMLSLQIEGSHNSFHILFAYSIQQQYGHSLAK
jgi:hypothetical protein